MQIEEIYIAEEIDMVSARKIVRENAQKAGFNVTDVTRIVTATLELSRNILLYAGKGSVQYKELNKDGRFGIELVFRDNGPGVGNIEEVMQPGYSTSKGLGLGLPGSKRLMDEMEIFSEKGKGTTIIVRKWVR